MINYLRKKILAKGYFARQSWTTKKNIHNSHLFNELNLNYRRYGKKNPNKFFYVIRRIPGAGFFSNLNFVVHNLYICESLGMIPVVDMQNYQTIYNCKTKIKNTLNSWNYYFKPVSKYKLEEVYKSKNVILCDNRTSNRGYDKKLYTSNSIFVNFQGFHFLDNRHKKIMKKYIRIKEDITNEANNFYKKYKNKKVLGVCFRGSDQKTSAYTPYTPTEKQMVFAVNTLLKKNNFDHIYLCTEDLDYLNFFKRKYKDKLIYNNFPRTTDKVDLFNYPSKNHRYKIGRGNLIDGLILSNVDHLLFACSNIPYASLFFAKKKIPYSVIENGVKGGVFTAGFSFYVRKFLPPFLGGFKNHLISRTKATKSKNSDFSRI